MIAIPNKSSFKLDEVCELTGVRPYVLRFWESEFDSIRPITSASGQKVYEHKDITVILKIKDLLVEQKLSVERARGILSRGPQPAQDSPSPRNPLNASDLQKLVLAKAKLQSIISKTRSMQNLLNGI